MGGLRQLFVFSYLVGAAPFSGCEFLCVTGVPVIHDRPSGVVQGVASLASSMLVSIVFSFLSVGISARLVEEEAMGLYFLILAVVYFLSVFGDFGFQSAIARFLAGTHSSEDNSKIFETVLTVVLSSLIGVALLAVIARPLLLWMFSEQIASIFIFVPVIYVFQTMEQTLASVMQGLKLFRRMAVVQGVTSVLNFCLVVVFLMVFRAGLEGLLLATLLTAVAMLLLRFVMIPLPKHLGFDWQLVRQMVRFGLPLQANSILTFISQRLDMLLLGALATPTAVAYLGVASKIPQNLQRLYQSVYAVFFPHMTELFSWQQDDQAAATLNRFLRLATLMTTSSALVALLFQNEIVLLIFSERYLPSAPGFGVLMVVICLSVMSSLLDYTLIAAGHPGYLPVISLADTVPSVIANLILIPAFGFMGAIAARLIANITTAPVSVWGIKREQIGVRLDVFFKPFIFMLVCYGAVWLVGVESLIVRFGGLVLFGALSVIFGLVTREDVVFLAGSLSLRRGRPVFDR